MRHPSRAGFINMRVPGEEDVIYFVILVSLHSLFIPENIFALRNGSTSHYSQRSCNRTSCKMHLLWEMICMSPPLARRVCYIIFINRRYYLQADNVCISPAYFRISVKEVASLHLISARWNGLCMVPCGNDTSIHPLSNSATTVATRDIIFFFMVFSS